MKVLRILWEFVLRDAKIAFSYRLQAFFQIASLFSIAVTFFFFSVMLRRVEGGIDTLQKYGGSYFAFAIIGVAVSLAVDASLRIFAMSIRTAQISGTFEAMLTSPAPIGAVVAGSGLYSLGYTLLRAGILIGLGAGVFGMPLHLEDWPAIALIVVLTLASTLALGVFSAGFIVLFKQGDPLTGAISGLSWLLSGVLYPKEILPGWVQDLAALLPLTHALESLRLALLLGAPIERLWGSIAGLGLFAALGLPISLLWFAWATRRARIAGSLARY
jgi:ABC-2 type transport system permease protein